LIFEKADEIYIIVQLSSWKYYYQMQIGCGSFFRGICSLIQGLAMFEVPPGVGFWFFGQILLFDFGC
jgi:hypothetical protein